MVSAAMFAVLLAIGLSSGGDESPSPTAGDRQERPAADRGDQAKPATAAKPGLSLRLRATAEVWVCLLGGDGAPLVNGQILYAGEEAGPYRSGSFTIAMGNGEIEMTVDGKRAQIPASSSPVGYEIDRGGRLGEIPEGELPTCT